MPSSDLIINVKQIAGYPSSEPPQPGDQVLVQRGGLGGPYYQFNADVFVANALADGTQPMQVGVTAPAAADGGQVFANEFCTPLDGTWLWNACRASGPPIRIASGAAGLMGFDPASGFGFYSAASGSAGSLVTWSNLMFISPSGDASLAGQLTLGRDPTNQMEAATANWVNARTMAAVAPLWSLYQTATVWSVNGRSGQIILGSNDVMSAGGAPINSPAFTGAPTAPSPAPAANDGELATTSWVWQAITASFQTQGVSSFNGRTGAVVLTASDVNTALGAGGAYAPLMSPQFSGVPTAPTASPGTQTGQLATTAFVMGAVQASTTGVASFNGRTGVITLTGSDVSGAGGALLVSPAFSGTPTGPTATAGNSSTQLATTAFVAAAVAASTAGVTSFNTRTGAVVLQLADVTGVGGAPLANPGLTGVPTAPTAAANTSTTQIATCAFVMASTVTTFNGRSGAVSLQANDISAASGLINPSPALTGNPTAPTQVAGTSNTTIATTAFVSAALAASGVSSFNTRTGAVTLSNADVIGVLPSYGTAPAMDGTASAGASGQWARGDHVHPTDTSRYAASNPSGFQTAAQVAAALPAPATVAPIMNGAAAVGTSLLYARQDHVHPSDTTRVPMAGATLNTSATLTSTDGGSNSAQLGPGGIAGANTNWTPRGASGPIGFFQIPVVSGGNGYVSSTTPTIGVAFGVGGDNGQLVRTQWISGSAQPVTMMYTNTGITAVQAVLNWTSTCSWSVTSCDERVKRNVHDCGDALAAVREVRVIECDYQRPSNEAQRALGDGAPVEHWDYTFSAQQVRERLPHAYLPPSNEDGYATLHPLHLIAALWRAVQQLSEKLDALEAR